MKLKYVVKLKYFENESVHTTYSELISHGYFQLLNEWRKKSSNFAKEILLSTREYYKQTYYEPSIKGTQMGNISMSDFKPIAALLKYWFAANHMDKDQWQISKIADFGFGVANPLCALIDEFQPSFVYASEINPNRYREFRDVIWSEQGHKIWKNERFAVGEGKLCHIVIDNRDLKTFCAAIKGQQKECVDFLQMKDKKLQHVCSENDACGGECQGRVNCLDLCLLYDVAEYLNDYDLQYCLDTIAEISYFLYFAVPTEKEYDEMEKGFDDKWAIHRSKEEYQRILLKSWSCVGNSIWESKVKCNGLSNIQNNVCHFS